MRILSVALVVLPLMASSAYAGDPAAGENDFKKCKACHAITAEDGTAIQNDGKTCPNLYGIIGRTAGSYEGFRYGAELVAAGEAGLV